ncbi:MAG: hypothetical protein BRC30_02455 [Nanohaloarchaea archaeon SW_7_46_7]|nr:MAG: hypothetical protein BRC30_02455 [Nanohaloarchaea archaeon SW_7_46_7]
MNFDCPQGVECEAVSDLSNNLEVEGGETVELVWTASPNGRTTGEINVEIQYDDIYGLSCSTTEPYSETYYLDEADPETQEGGN